MTRVDVETAREMLAACEAALPPTSRSASPPSPTGGPRRLRRSKIKKGQGGPPALTLVENPDILATLPRPSRSGPKLVVGFAAETDDVEANAQAKLARKGCDWIVANDVTERGVMGGDEQRGRHGHQGGHRALGPRRPRPRWRAGWPPRIAEDFA